MASSADARVPTEGDRTEPVHPAWRRWLEWAVVIAVIVAVAEICGLDVRAWLESVWDTMMTISTASLVAYIVLCVVKTTGTAVAWYGILHYAFPGDTRWRDIYAAYAVSVALNNILPANLGTLVMLIMFSVTIAGASFAAILGGYAVEKIFFTLAGGFVYLYLFLTVTGSFDWQFNFVNNHPWATAVALIGGAYLIYVAVRRLWPRVVHWWEEAKEGGAILGNRRAYFGWVFFPSFIGWVASLGTIGVMLAAYDIPATFDTIMHVAGGNSLANVTAVTPGGAGVNQAFNVASLRGVTTSENATAYSVASQLLGTAWNILFAIVLMIWAWGWTGGKQLVSDSYGEAKRRTDEERAKRREKKAAEKEATA